ncbi:proline racemase [Desulfotomaculum arcticum]|uniref:Proline racemase n=1 Tax=Desulfotruncus arcticus DSM 17038 TaxID=1121424 RepID=A0A1I2WM29_9FIRM|nr:proline racemase family protein [Desulfotruncus arcticus]SFH02304.1 proline racemase [Desulfotomaculum arcticum] [Desulfotruncus arcticus DSM 17038]
MKFERLISVVDSHTAGEPTRVIVGGIPYIPGHTITEKKIYLEQNLDYIRTALMHEPRGHSDMFGSILTAPGDPRADMGIIFMDTGGYLNMCGHGTIGAVTIMIETGMLKVVEPVTRVVLDTPAGLVTARAQVEDGAVREVTFENVPAFLFESGVVEVGGKNIPVDVAFGGNFFAIVNAADLGLRVCPEQVKELKEIGMEILKEVNRKLTVQHPIFTHINKIDLVEICDKPSVAGANIKNVVIFGKNQVDRSPCGTGTCAKLATLIAKGQLQINEELVNESILGTTFKGKALKAAQIGAYQGIIPQITGSAYITGLNNFVINKNDPLKYGFLL